jgi:hypothetical protein
VEGNG